MLMREFFEDDAMRLSMTRLLCFLSFFPSTYLTMVLKTETALAMYMSTFALAYLGGKGIDLMTAKKENVVVTTLTVKKDEVPDESDS